MANQKNQAKSILGKPTVVEKVDDTPGPQTYNQIYRQAIPGFKIVQPDAKVKKDENKPQVGPSTYTPFNPSLQQSNHLHQQATSIGNSRRTDMVQRIKVPGPGRYEYDDGFKKAPKFHLGQKVASFMGKNLEMPGPG